MMDDPSVSAFKSRHQTTSRCLDGNKQVLNGRKKRSRYKRDQVRIKETNESEPVKKLCEVATFCQKLAFLAASEKL